MLRSDRQMTPLSWLGKFLFEVGKKKISLFLEIIARVLLGDWGANNENCAVNEEQLPALFCSAHNERVQLNSFQMNFSLLGFKGGGSAFSVSAPSCYSAIFGRLF